MAPSRRLSPAYAARNARARAAGYKSYYDFRVHNHGAIPPSQPAPTGEARSRLRGHRSAEDLRKSALDGAMITVTDHSGRDNKGRYKWVELTVIDAKGVQRTYRLSGKQLKPEFLRKLIEDVQAGGAVLSPSPSLDLRRYSGDDDLGEIEELEAA